MDPWPSALLAVVLATTGCATLLGPDPAPLPPEGEAFTVVARGCGMQLTEHESVWVTYPDRTLHHLVVAVEANRTDEDGEDDPEDRRSDDVNLAYKEVLEVLEDANATGAFPLDHYLEESRDNGYDRVDLWHAETGLLEEEAFEGLREAVTRADLGQREDRYMESTVSDGCGIDLAAWTPDGSAHVFRTTGSGPQDVQALDELHETLHPDR